MEYKTNFALECKHPKPIMDALRADDLSDKNISYSHSDTHLLVEIKIDNLRGLEKMCKSFLMRFALAVETSNLVEEITE